jgi:fatty acid/phospholipid biosynthesis enzyme
LRSSEPPARCPVVGEPSQLCEVGVDDDARWDPGELVGFAVVGGVLFKSFGGMKKPRVRRAAAETMPPVEEQ